MKGYDNQDSGPEWDNYYPSKPTPAILTNPQPSKPRIRPAILQRPGDLPKGTNLVFQASLTPVTPTGDGMEVDQTSSAPVNVSDGWDEDDVIEGYQAPSTSAMMDNEPRNRGVPQEFLARMMLAATEKDCQDGAQTGAPQYESVEQRDARYNELRRQILGETYPDEDEDEADEEGRSKNAIRDQSEHRSETAMNPLVVHSPASTVSEKSEYQVKPSQDRPAPTHLPPPIVTENGRVYGTRSQTSSSDGNPIWIENAQCFYLPPNEDKPRPPSPSSSASRTNRWGQMGGGWDSKFRGFIREVCAKKPEPPVFQPPLAEVPVHHHIPPLQPPPQPPPAYPYNPLAFGHAESIARHHPFPPTPHPYEPNRYSSYPQPDNRHPSQVSYVPRNQPLYGPLSPPATAPPATPPPSAPLPSIPSATDEIYRDTREPGMVFDEEFPPLDDT